MSCRPHYDDEGTFLRKEPLPCRKPPPDPSERWLLLAIALLGCVLAGFALAGGV